MYNAGEKCRDKMVAGSNQRDAAVRAAVMKTIKALDVQQVWKHQGSFSRAKDVANYLADQEVDIL